MKMQNEAIAIARDHAWNYFSLHAQQRISVFQYFISIETALITAAIITIQYRKDFGDPTWPIVLGPAIILFSFVFWKIDQRTRDLIDKAESSLRQIEVEIKKNLPTSISLPFTEDPQSKNSVEFRAFPLIPGRLTYSQSFGTIYSISALFGALFLVISLKFT